MKTRCFLQQPLLHFLLIGAAIFALHSALDDTPSVSANRIIVSDEVAEQLAAKFESLRRRRPTARELSKLMDEFIREEVLVREATALSLDRNDAVIRRRLRQKMEFLTSSAAAAIKPSDEELTKYFASNAKRYTVSAKVAFEQIYLGETPSDREVEAARNAVAAGTYRQPDSTKSLLLLPSALPLSSKGIVDRTFGAGFFDRIRELETERWGSAVRSGYGVHLVRITKFVPARVPVLAEVRGAVERDWLRVRTAAVSEAQYARMLVRYQVDRPDLSAIKVQR